VSGVVFVVPPGRPPSGGDLYNRFFLEALKDEGFRFETAVWEDAGLDAPAGAEEVWVDSLYIPRLAEALRDAPRRGPRIFLVVHSLPSEDPGLGPEAAGGLRTVEDLLFARVTGFLATGRPTAESIGRRVGPAKPILLVPPALCVRPTGKVRVPDTCTGLIVSSLIRGKGVPAFLEALAGRVRPQDAFRLRVAGRTDIEPGTAAECLAAVRAHSGLRERVVHLGHLSLDEVAREYEGSSVFVSPSPREGHGMAFHEARAFGLPVLAIRAPYSEPFIAPGSTGFLYDSPDALARGLLGLVRRPERLRSLEAAARRRPARTDYLWPDAARSFLRQRTACAIVPSR